MKKFMTYWVIWVISFITVDGSMELGGFGTIYHQNLSSDIFMFGFILSFVMASFATLIASSAIEN